MKFIKCNKCGRYFRVTDDDYCLSKCTGCGSTNLEETIYKPISYSNIDWEQRRYEIAKSAMNGILSRNNNLPFNTHEKEVSEEVARVAVALADALIAELKNK